MRPAGDGRFYGGRIGHVFSDSWNGGSGASDQTDPIKLEGDAKGAGVLVLGLALHTRSL